jgi:hypothetical protein
VVAAPQTVKTPGFFAPMLICIKASHPVMPHKSGMDIIDRDSDQPLCPLCSVSMPLVHSRLRQGADLHRFECVPCGVAFTESTQAHLVVRFKHSHPASAGHSLRIFESKDH